MGRSSLNIPVSSRCLLLRVIRKVPRGLKECSENLTPSSGQQVSQEKWSLGSRILACPLLSNNTRRSTSPVEPRPTSPQAKREKRPWYLVQAAPYVEVIAETGIKNKIKIRTVELGAQRKLSKRPGSWV